jgi:D-aspartate ligase
VDLPPVVLLGGSTNAVSVARSLGRMGVQVYAIAERRTQVAYSRFCSSFTVVGARGSVTETWLGWLLESAPRRAVVIPCDDDGLEIVACHRSELTAAGLRPCPGNDRVILEMLDKERTLERARELEVPAPRSARVSNRHELLEEARSLGLPVLLKPVHGHRFQRVSGLRAKAIVISDQRDLARAADLVDRLGMAMTVGEIVPGPDDSLYFYWTYIDEHGRALFDLVERQLRQFPPGFGVASYRMTVEDAEVVSVGRRFLEGVGARGLAQVELKRDAQDGALKLIECNHRLGAGAELVRLAGIDVARLVYSHALGRPIQPCPRYRVGVRLWHVVDDVRAFLELRRQGALSWLGWSASLCHRKRLAVFRPDDPMPTVGYLAARALSLARA